MRIARWPCVAAAAAVAALACSQSTGPRAPEITATVAVLASGAEPPGYADSAIAEVRSDRYLVVRSWQPGACDAAAATPGWVRGGGVILTLLAGPPGCTAGEGPERRWLRVTVGPLPRGEYPLTVVEGLQGTTTLFLAYETTIRVP